MKRKQTPEGALLRLVMDWLAAEHILAYRMNTLAMPTADGKRFIKAGVLGMADVLAFPQLFYSDGIHPTAVRAPYPVWIELKAPKGKQSDFQKSFQAQVEAEGHSYILAHRLEDVQAALCFTAYHLTR